MKLSAVALCGSALSLLTPSLAQAIPQSTTFNASSGNAGTDYIWETGTNWSNGVPDTTGTAIVSIGNFDPANGGIFIDSNPTIGSLTFNSSLTGALTISSAPITLTVEGAIVNNSSFQQVISTASLVAGGNATWNAGTGGLVINNLSVGTNTIQVTGTGGIQLVTSSALNFTINSTSSYGSIGPVTVSNVPINITSTANYAGTAGDFFQLFSRTSSLSGLSLTNGSISPGTGLSFVSTLLNKGILYVATTGGGTVINSGVILPVGNDTEFNPTGTATSGIIFNGGELLTNNNNLSVINGSLDTGGTDGAAFSTVRPITIDSGSSATLAATTATTGTYTAAISDGGTPGTLTIGDATNAGLGTVLLSAASTYADATNIISGATFKLGVANAAQDSTITVNAANGLTFTSGVGAFTIGGLSGTGNETLADTASTAITLQVGNGNGSSTYGGVLSGTGGALTKVGTGTFTLSVANSYTGLTTVSAGTLASGATNAIASGNNLTTAATGTFNLAGHSQTLGLLTNGGTVTSSAGGGVLTIGGGSTGAGNFTGTMNVTFNQGATGSSLTGSFTNTGTLNLNANGAGTIGVSTANNTGTVVNNGTGAGTTTIGSVGVNVTGVTQNSSTSALTITMLNPNAGGTTLTSGGTAALTVTNSVANSTGNLTLQANTTGSIVLAGGADNIGAITNSGTGAGTSTVSGTIGMSVTSVNQNSSTSNLILNGAGTYGALNILLGTVQVGASTSAGGGTVTIGSTGNAGTLDLNGQTEAVKALATGGTAANQTITNSNATAATLNYTGATTSSFGGIIKNGAGTTGVTVNNATANLTLSGANTYTGPTTVTAGTLKANVATVAGTSGAFGVNSAVSIGTGTLDLASFATQIGSLAGAGTVIDSAAATTLTIGADNSSPTYSGVIANALSLTKIGTGTETLSGANSYTGTTTVSAGVLAIGANNSITSGGALTTTAGTFDLAGHTQTLGLLTNGGTVTSSAATGNLTIGNGSTGAGNFTGTLNVTFNQVATSSALTGTFTNTGSLTLNANGAGTIGITSANNTGAITNSGTGAGATTITTVGTNVTGVTQGSSTSALTLTTLNANLAGTTLTSTGTALLSVTNAVAMTGNLTLDANSTGSITLVGGANNVGTIVNAGTSTGTSTITGAITGNLTSVTENSTGSELVLNGAGSYGSLNIQKGTVQAGTSTSVGIGTVTIGAAGTAGTLDLNGQTEAVAALATAGTAGSQTITNTNATTATLNYNGATMSTFGGLIKNGTGTTALTVNNANAVLTLSGANTYTGLTTITTGTLKIGATNAVASGNTLTTAATGTLDVDGNSETLGLLTNGGTVTSSAATGNLTIGNGSTGAGNFTGTLNVTFNQGAASSTLSGNFTNTGSLTLNANGAGAIGLNTANNTGAIVNSGTGAGTTTIGGAIGSNVTSVSENSTTSKLLLDGAGTYAALNIQKGTVMVGATTAVGTGTVTIGSVGNTGTLDLNGETETVDGLATAGTAGSQTITNSNATAATLNYTGGTSSFGGVIQNGAGTTAVTVNNAGAIFTLANANTFSGGLNIQQGTVKVGTTTSVGTGTVTIGATGTSGTLDLSGMTETIDGLATAGTAANQTITNGSSTAAVLNYTGATSSTFGGVIQDGTGTTAVTLNSVGNTLTLSGVSTYTGTTTVTAGTLALSGAGNIADSNSVSLNTGSFSIAAASGNRTVNNLNGTFGSTIILGGNTLTDLASTTGTVVSIIQGTGGFIKSGTGTVGLNGDNTYSGGTTITAGTLDVGSGNANSQLGSGGVNVATNAVLAYTGTIAHSENNLIMGGGSVEQIGSGTTTLTAANTYTGGTVIGIPTFGQGTLAVSGAGTLGASTGSLTIYAGTLNLGTTTQTVGAVTVDNHASDQLVNIQTGTLTASSYNFDVVSPNAGNPGVTVESDLAGTGSLTETGTGTLLLQGANTFSGGVNIQQATLQVDAGTSLGTGTVTIGSTGNAGTLDLNGQTETVDGLATAGTAASQTITNSNATAATLNYTGASSNFAGLIKNGTGTTALTVNNAAANLTLSGANTYTGLTTVTTGTLTLGASNAIASGNALTTVSGGIFDVAGKTETLGLVTNGGNVTSSAAGGALTVGNGSTGAGTFTGTMNLTFAQGAASSALTGNITNTGNLTLNATGAGTIGITFANNTGTIINSGTGAGASTVATVGTNVTGVTQNSSTSALTVSTLGLNAAGTTVTSGGTALTTVTNLVTGAANLTLNANSTGSITLTGGANNGGIITNSGTGSGTTTLGAIGANVSFVNQNSATSALVLSGAGAYNALNINQGTVKVGTATSVGTGTVTLGTAGSGTLDLNGQTEVVRAIATAGTAANQTIMNNSGTAAVLDITGAATSAFGGVIKNGTGTTSLTVNNASAVVTLSGANTYTGATTISAGTVNISGSTAAGSAVALNGGLLNVSGSVGGAVTVASGAVLSSTGMAGTIGSTNLASGATIDLTKDAAIGTLHIGSLTTTGGAMDFEIGGGTTQTDKITTGTLSIGTGTTINLANLGGTSQTLTDGLYTLLSYSGTASGLGNLTLATTSLDNQTLMLVISNTGLVQVQVMPPVSLTTYTLTSSSVATRVATTGSTTITSTITNTGSADTLTYAGLNATATTGTNANAGTLSGGTLPMSTGGGTPLAASGGTASGTATYTAPATAGSVIITPTVTTATNTVANTPSTLTNTATTTINVVANRTENTTAVNLGRVIVGQTTANQATTVSSVTGDDSTLTRTTLATGTQSDTVTNGTVRLINNTAYTFGGANDAVNSTTANVNGTFTAAGNQTGSASYTVTGEGLSGENVNNISVTYSADAVNNRTENATTVNLGRVMVGQTTGSQTTTVSSITGDDSTLTRTTLAAGTQHDSVTNGTVTLTNGTSYTFGGANDATNSTTAGITGNFTTAGTQSGMASYTLTGEGLTGETVNPLSVSYTADAVNNRTESATAVALGRVMVGQTTSSVNTTVSSVTGDDSTLTRTTLAAGTQHATVTNGTVTLTNGTSYTFGGANDATNSTTAGITGSFTTAGDQSGTASYAVTGEGLAGEMVNPLSVSYTADAVNNRTESATSVNLGRVLVGVTSGSQSTTVSSITGDDSTLTRTTLAMGSQNATGAQGTVTLTNGTSYTFGGANDATNSTTANVTGNFTTAGMQSGTAMYSLTGEGLTGETVNPLSVAFTADAVNMRTITNGTTTNLGTFHTGATISVAANAFTSTGANATTTSVQVAGGTGMADANGVTLTGGTTSFLGATSTAVNGTTQTFGGTITSAMGGVTTGSFTLGVTTLENGGAGLTGETAYSNVTVAYTATVYTGQGVWNTNGGGSWGTVVSPLNWQANGGAPGLDANFTNTDSATFGSVLTTGTANILLGGDNPSLNAITFNNTNTASYNIEGTGGGSTGTITLDGNGSAALLTDSATGTQTINAPVVLDANGVSINVTTGDTLGIGGVISGAGALATATGTGTTVLTGSNIYTGNTTVGAGTVQVGNGISGSLSNATMVSVSNGATLAFNETSGSNQSNTIADAGTVQGLAGTGVINTLSGNISGAGGFTQTGTGTTLLSGADTYNGPTAVNAGTLQIGNDNNGSISNTSTVTVATGAAIAFDEADGSTQSNNITLTGTGMVQGVELGGTTNTLSGTIGGAATPAGSFIQTGSGTTVLTGTNANLGSATLSAGSVIISNSAALGAGLLTLNAGATLSDGAANVTLANNVVLNGNFTFAGTGTLTFMGGTFTTPNSGAVMLTIDNTTTIADSITGGAALTKLGTGTLGLTGNNSAYTGTTAIDAGTLTVSNANAIGSGPVTLSNSGVFDYTGTTPATFANTFSVLGGTPSVPAFAEIENTSGDLLTLSSAVNKPDANLLISAGTGSIVISGQITSSGATGAFDSDMYFTNGTTTLTNANNSYTGATHIFGNGVLIDGVNNAVPASSDIILGNPNMAAPLAETANSTNTYVLNGFTQTLSGLDTTNMGAFTDTNSVVGGSATLSALSIVTVGAHTFDGIIGGAGANQNNISLAISGTGTETLAGFGPNTYTGGTTISGSATVALGIMNAFGTGPVMINGGTVIVGNSQGLGTGNVALAGGTLMTSAIPGGGGLDGLPANHDIFVGGTFTQSGGTLVFGIGSTPDGTGAGANNDVLDVTGAVAINSGSILALNIAPSVVPSLMKGSTFLVISSNSAVTLAANTQAVVINPAGFQITATLDPSTEMLSPPPTIVGNGDDVYLTITSTSFALTSLLSGGTPNENAILSNIDMNINTSTNPQLASAITQALIGTPTAATAATIADSFNPAKFGNFVQSNIVNNAVFSTQELTSYIASGRSEHGDFLVSNGGIDSTGLTVVDPTMDPALAQTGSRLLAWSPAPFAHGMLSDSSTPLLTGTDSKDMTPVPESLSGHNFSTFVVGNVVLAQNFSQPGVTHSDSTTGGVQLGADYRVTPHLRAGVMFGFNHTDASLDNVGSKATIDTYAPGGYISFADGGWYANAVGNYGFNSYTEDRTVSIAGLSARAHGAPTGDQVTGDLDGGYDFHVKSLTFGPLAGLQYTHLTVDSYGEDGAEALGANLAVGEQTGSSLRSRLGGHISYVYQTGKVLLTPHLDASWQHEFMNQTDGITGQLTGAATPFSVTTSSASRDSVLLDGGLNADISGQVTIFGDYLIQAGQSNYFGQSVQAGVKIGF